MAKGKVRTDFSFSFNYITVSIFVGLNATLYNIFSLTEVFYNWYTTYLIIFFLSFNTLLQHFKLYLFDLSWLFTYKWLNMMWCIQTEKNRHAVMFELSKYFSQLCQFISFCYLRNKFTYTESYTSLVHWFCISPYTFLSLSLLLSLFSLSFSLAYLIDVFVLVVVKNPLYDSDARLNLVCICDPWFSFLSNETTNL